MKRLSRNMIAAGALAGLATVMIVLQSSNVSASQTSGYTVTGCWYVDVYFGDPSNPATPKLPMIATFDDSGTMLWTSTGSWGGHPLMPGNKGGAHGLWERRGMNVRTRGIWFDEAGGGVGMSIGRAIGELTFNGPDELSGIADFEFLPCPSGYLGCVDPTQLPPLQMGGGVGPFPIVFRRLP